MLVVVDGGGGGRGGGVQRVNSIKRHEEMLGRVVNMFVCPAAGHSC